MSLGWGDDLIAVEELSPAEIEEIAAADALVSAAISGRCSLHDSILARHGKTNTSPFGGRGYSRISGKFIATSKNMSF